MSDETKGLWRVFSVYAQHEVRTPTDTLIAVVQSREHARLISAAPELLDALSMLTDHCRRMGFDTREEEPLLQAADAAIFKANGVQS